MWREEAVEGQPVPRGAVQLVRQTAHGFQGRQVRQGFERLGQVAGIHGAHRALVRDRAQDAEAAGALGVVGQQQAAPGDALGQRAPFGSHGGVGGRGGGRKLDVADGGAGERFGGGGGQRACHGFAD